MKQAASPAFGIPSIVSEVFANFVATEYAYFTSQGEPLCWPVTPYWYEDRGVLALATGLAYPKKADLSKKNPKVAMLFSDPTSSGLEDPPTVLLHGVATVLDDDIQGNTDRYVRELREKFLVARIGLNPVSVKFLDFYLPRLWVEVTPLRVLVWKQGDITPQVHGVPLPLETPERQVGSPKCMMSPADLATLRATVMRMPDPVLTVVGPDGFPSMARVKARVRPDEFGGTLSGDDAFLELSDSPGVGPAALTFHKHSLGGTRFSAYMVRGAVGRQQGPPIFVPSRLLGFFGNGAVFPLSAIPRVMQLRKSLRRELAKRGKPMPKLRVP